MDNQLRAPIRFSRSVERLGADEAKTTQGLIATMRYITEKTLADGGHAIRGVHAKSHGILEGYLEVDESLPVDLAQGMFAKPGRYPTVMRLSTIPGDILDDSVSTPRGMAVKIIGVEGERLEGSETDVTQDFVLINGPAFGAPTPRLYEFKIDTDGDAVRPQRCGASWARRLRGWTTAGRLSSKVHRYRRVRRHE